MASGKRTSKRTSAVKRIAALNLKGWIAPVIAHLGLAVLTLLASGHLVSESVIEGNSAIGFVLLPVFFSFFILFCACRNFLRKKISEGVLNAIAFAISLAVDIGLGFVLLLYGF